MGSVHGTQWLQCTEIQRHNSDISFCLPSYNFKVEQFRLKIVGGILFASNYVWRAQPKNAGELTVFKLFARNLGRQIGGKYGNGKLISMCKS